MSSATRRLFYVDGEPKWLTDEELSVTPGVVMPTQPQGVLPGYSEGRPGKSLAMGCHRRQIGLLNKTIKEQGIRGVRYVPDKHGGRCEITSRRGRAEWMKVFGSMHGLGALHDEDGGYGDG